jgi:NH3-dependent NAD+ synthetase
MQLSLLHPLGTVSHRVNEGDLKKRERKNRLAFIRKKKETLVITTTE